MNSKAEISQSSPSKNFVMASVSPWANFSAVRYLMSWSRRLCRKCGGKCFRSKKVWLEAALEDGAEIHEPDSLENYSGQFKLRIPRSLHRSLAEHSQREGISMNQYCVYLLSRNDAALSR